MILEEIGMYDDSPAFLAYDLAMQTHFDGHPLGKRILGTTDSVGALTAAQMRDYFQQHYRAGNITLVATGQVDWDELLALAKQHCDRWPAGRPERHSGETRPAGGVAATVRAAHQQQNIMQFAAAPPASSPLRYAAELLSVIIGDDGGSRLYWQLVDPGAAEAAELTYNDYTDSGCWCTYLSCVPEDTADNLSQIRELYAEVNAEGVTDDELEQARNKVATCASSSGRNARWAGCRPWGRTGSSAVSTARLKTTCERCSR